jgi:hypothetical protein
MAESGRATGHVQKTAKLPWEPGCFQDTGISSLMRKSLEEQHLNKCPCHVHLTVSEPQKVPLLESGLTFWDPSSEGTWEEEVRLRLALAVSSLYFMGQHSPSCIVTIMQGVGLARVTPSCSRRACFEQEHVFCFNTQIVTVISSPPIILCIRKGSRRRKHFLCVSAGEITEKMKLNAEPPP